MLYGVVHSRTELYGVVQSSTELYGVVQNRTETQWKLFSNCGNYFFKEKHQFLKKISLKYQ